MMDMEYGTRGYIVTGDESFLRLYLEGTKRFDSEYQAFYQLVADSPPQQQRLEDIYAGYGEWEEYADRIIALRRAGKADPTLYENRKGNARWIPSSPDLEVSRCGRRIALSDSSRAPAMGSDGHKLPWPGFGVWGAPCSVYPIPC